MQITRRQYIFIKLSNLNNFDYKNDQSFNNVNVSFVNSLRNPIVVGELNKTVHDIPGCFGRTTISLSQKHTSQDIVKLANMGQHEHLIKNRIGIKPLLGSVIFETTLRSYTAKPTTARQDLPTRNKRTHTQQNSELPPLKDPFIQIQEKNMNQFAHCLKEEKQGTIKPAYIEWIMSLKRERRKNRTKKNI